MNIRDLKYFIAVAETRHFGKAAEQCFVSQPTLSGQIKKLEEEIGVTLFERTRRSVNITPAGQEVLVIAKRLMEQADAIFQVARAHDNPLSGPLRVGAIHTISPYLIPLILAPLKKTYPDMILVLTEDITEHLLQRLHEHQLDAAILATEVNDPEFVSIPLFEEPFWLAHPRDHYLYLKDDITPKDLEGLDLLLLAEGHCLTRQVMDVCHIKPEAQSGDLTDLRAASLETLVQMVAAGYGTTLIPALAVGGSWVTGSGVILRKLDIRDAKRDVHLVYRKTFPRVDALKAMIAVLKDNLPNTVQVDGRKKGRKKSNLK